MRVGELTFSQHVAKAANVHLATNKEKILVVLYSLKMHSEAVRPQKIKIIKNNNPTIGGSRNFCPFEILHRYIKLRGEFIESKEEPFFIFRDRTPVQAKNIRKLLAQALSNLGLDSSLYRMHSLRIGRASELIKFNDLEFVKRVGRWRSNVVYKYLRN